MSSDNLKMVIVKDDKILVNKENQEIPKDSIIHCLGSLFKLTESGLSHVVGKIDDNSYFADPQFFQKLNELAFVDQVEVATPEAVPQREGLLALALQTTFYWFLPCRDLLPVSLFCIRFPGFLVPRCALLFWGIFVRGLRVETFVRVLRSSELSLNNCK